MSSFTKSEASYIIYSGSAGGPYFAKNGSTGKVDYSGSDVGFIVSSSINSMLKGGKIAFKQGKYYLSSTVTIQRNSMIFEGEGVTTEISYSGGSIPVFDIQSGANLTDITFRHLYFNGNNQASKAITTENLTTQKRMRFLTVENCRFEDFETGSLWLKNSELCRFDNNDFVNDTISIMFYGDDYYCGNNVISRNFFMHSSNNNYAVYVSGSAVDKEFNNIVSKDNHYYANETNTPDHVAIFLNASGSQIRDFICIGDRSENCSYLEASGSNIIDAINIGSCWFMSSGSRPTVTFRSNVDRSTIHDNIFRMSTNGTGSFDESLNLEFTLNRIINNSFTMENSNTTAIVLVDNSNTIVKDNLML